MQLAYIWLNGDGNMAEAMARLCRARGIKVVHSYLPLDCDNSTKAVAVHFGKGDTLSGFVSACEDRGVPLIQGSTLDQSPEEIVAGRTVVYIDAPNLSLPMLRFMMAFPEFVTKLRGSAWQLNIAESHQQSKSGVSGTARAIANALNLAPEEAIRSVRDPAIQLALGVPPLFLDAHAYHVFTLTGEGVEFQITTKIHGRETYAEGALTLAKLIAKQETPLLPGVYQATDIVGGLS